MKKHRGVEKPTEMHDAGDRIIMDISIEEAMTLEFILSHVGGSENASPRKFADSVYRALHAAGVTHLMPDNEQHSTGSIFFKDGDIREYSKYSGSK